jgi:hypothetical protein
MPALKPLFVAAMLATTPALAQDHPGRPSSRVGAPQPQPEAAVSPEQQQPPAGEPTLSIDFPGGTVGQYVEALRHGSSQPVNIVLPPRAAKVPMPPVSLKAVTLVDAINAVIAIADIPADEDWGVRPLATLSGIISNGPSGESVPGYAIMVQQRGTRVMPGGPQFAGGGGAASRTEVYAVRDLLDSGMKPEAVLTAIDTALRMDQRTEPPDVKFHEESGLLILRATSDQLEAARQVVTRLVESAKSGARARSAKERHEQFERLRAEIDPLYSELAKAKADAASQRATLQPLINTLPPNSPEEQQKRQARLQEGEARFAQMEIVVDRLERDVRNREDLMKQLRAAELGVSDDPSAEIARLREENNDLRARLEKLEKKSR